MESNTQHWRAIRTLGQHLWPKNRMDLKWRVCFAMFFLIFAKVLNVYVPFLLKESIDDLSAKQSVIILPLALILAYGIARILVQVFGELRDLIFVKVGQNAQRAIALSTFQHLHNLSLDYHLSRQTGGLSRVIERGTRGIQFILNFMTFNVVPTLFEIALVTVIVCVKFNLIYAAVIFVTIAIYIFMTLMVTEWRLKYRAAMNLEETRANTSAIDSLLNYETVKYFGNEEHEYRRFDKSLKGYEEAAVRNQYGLSLLNLGQASIIGIGLLIVMVMAGQGVTAGKLTVGDFVLLNSFLIQLYLPLNFLGFVYREIKNSLIDMDKMFELTEIDPKVKDNKESKQLVVKNGTIEFKQVDFNYRPNRQVLKNVSFTIRPGETLALVGPSGSGKSTIARLLFRFYDVTGGVILVDGQDIRNVTQKSLRAAIGVVPQDSVLFNDSIGYNIIYGNPGVTDEKMKDAAKLANIHHFVESLPEKYETQVGERGLKLSGGEKQRVAIARTILKDPPILIFDEATSALDSHNEKEIQGELRKISQKRTTLVIAHRLSTIVDADQILVLRDGKIVEQGRHNQLLALNGEYALMWSKQLQENNVDSVGSDAEAN